MEKNSFKDIVKNLCTAEGIRGTGVHDCVTGHGTRGAMVSFLLQAGESDASVALRSFHRNLCSIKRYSNLQGELGRQQQKDLFSDILNLPQPENKKRIEGPKFMLPDAKRIHEPNEDKKSMEDRVSRFLRQKELGIQTKTRK